MALRDFVKTIKKSALLAHLQGVDEKTAKWRKDLLDAVVTKDELVLQIGTYTSHADLADRDLDEQHPATAIETDVSSFGGLLSSADTDVQLALDTLDDIDLAGSDTDAIHDNVAAEISAITEKAIPVDADIVIIEDSEDSYNKKKVLLSSFSIGSGTDDDAIHDNVAEEIHAIAEKSTSVAEDEVVIEDSEDSWNKKRLQIGNVSIGGASTTWTIEFEEDEGYEVNDEIRSHDDWAYPAAYFANELTADQILHVEDIAPFVDGAPLAAEAAATADYASYNGVLFDRVEFQSGIIDVWTRFLVVGNQVVISFSNKDGYIDFDTNFPAFGIVSNQTTDGVLGVGTFLYYEDAVNGTTVSSNLQTPDGVTAYYHHYRFDFERNKQYLSVWDGLIGDEPADFMAEMDVLIAPDKISMFVFPANNEVGSSSTFFNFIIKQTSFVTLGNLTHGSLLGLEEDDHPHYVTRSDWTQNGFPDTSDISIGFVDGTRTFTIGPTVGDYISYFNNGRQYDTASCSIVLDDTEGLWVIYFDEETIVSLNSPSEAQIDDILETKCIIAYVYWDATNAEGKLFGELHGCLMSPATHHYLHDNLGAQFKTGMALGDILADEDGSSNTHAQFSTAIGSFYDEDVLHEIEATLANAGLEIYYFDGSDLRWTTNAGYSFINGGTGRIMFNDAGSQTEVGNTKFVLAHVFATNVKDADGTDGRLIAVQGQAQYDTLTAARDGADTEIHSLITGDLPMEEIVPVATVIFQTADAYTNDVNARIRSTSTGDDYVDWRTVSLSGGAGSVTDHGLLSGLADDDHTQYLLANGTRGLSADWDAGTWEIRANTFESDVATGTAPLTIASTTVVTNLNAEFFDGFGIKPTAGGGYFLNCNEDGGINYIDATTYSDGSFVKRDLPSAVIEITVKNDTEIEMVSGDLCYISGISSGVPTVDLADADSATTSSGMLVVLGQGISSGGGTGEAVVFGCMPGLTGLTTGQKLYVSTSPGDITSTAPSGTGDIVRIIGYALSTTTMYFKPDNTYVEVA